MNIRPYKRPTLAWKIAFTILATAALFASPITARAADDNQQRPNILLAIADDWGYPYASAYGVPVVQTPNFDSVAQRGVLFTHAFTCVPSCTPSRGAILTGQFFARLEQGANLWGPLPSKFPVYTNLLEQAGYHVGYTGKGWGPGWWWVGGWEHNPAGKHYDSFEQFLDARPDDKPFCFWYGSHDPHRGYKKGSGAASGMDLSKVHVPAALPDHPVVRSDIADFLVEVQQFDKQVGRLLEELKQRGELDNTIVVVTGDHGMPFPRGKTNLYDLGTRVPLAVMWPAKVEGGRKIHDFVTLTDLAPTFLEAAGVEIPDVMTATSILGLLTSGESGWINPNDDYVILGRERHTTAQEYNNTGGYPMRAIRTEDFLYIRNFEPERWPVGTPNAEEAYLGQAFADCDPGPTKRFIMEHRDDPKYRKYYELAFSKRPEEELYDLRKDPYQLNNVADNPAYSKIEYKLAHKLMAELRRLKDPRGFGEGELFDTYYYFGSSSHNPMIDEYRAMFPHP